MRQFLILFSLTCLPITLFGEAAPVDYQKEIAELEKSISNLTQWQKQYKKKQKSFESQRRRILFRDRSPKDAKRVARHAEDAKENILELQRQIDMLEDRKKSLLEAQQ